MLSSIAIALSAALTAVVVLLRNVKHAWSNEQ